MNYALSSADPDSYRDGILTPETGGLSANFNILQDVMTIIGFDSVR
ncbi:hypothetical protein [Algoriphagus boritolerans]